MFSSTDESWQDRLLDGVEQDIGMSPPTPAWADALSICEQRGLTERSRGFLDKCLEKMVAACIQQSDRSDNLTITMIRASKQIGVALASDFSPWAAKSLIVLIPGCNGTLPVIFRESADLQHPNQLFQQCAGAVAAKVKKMVQQLELRGLLFNWCRDRDRVDQLEAVLRAVNMHETTKVGIAGHTLKSLADRVLEQLNEISFDKVPAALTEDGSGKQMSTDGLECLDRLLQLAGDEYAERGRLVWKQLAVSCIQSSKLMLRRAGLDILAKLAEIIPVRAGEWMVAGQDGGQGESVLDCLTGERAHEKLVDALRNFVYTHAHQRSLSEVNSQGMDLNMPRIIDSMLATCVGNQQHPTKDVRDAFRSALAKLTVTLPYTCENLEEKKGNKGRVEVAMYLIAKLLAQLRSETQGAADLALLTLTLPAPHSAYDHISQCMPSPKYLVSACTDSQCDTVEAQLARSTFDLLFESLVHPTLAQNYTQLLHALAVCFQNGACTGRPGSDSKLQNDVLHFVRFCTAQLQMKQNNTQTEFTLAPDAVSSSGVGVGDALPLPTTNYGASIAGLGRSNGVNSSSNSKNAAERSSRTIVMRLLLDVLFFHLRNDSVAQGEKWTKAMGSIDHPNRMDWAKEGRVPMLKMTRGAFLEACQRDHSLAALIVDDTLRLEEEAQRQGRADTSEHEEEQWLRLQVLRFLHVEQDNKQLQKVSFSVLDRLWHRLPSELLCKWLRVLADSGDALSEEVTEKAFKGLVCGIDLPMLGKHGFNCFEALFGEINSRHTQSHPTGRMQISGRQVVHKGIKISGQNLVRRRVSWFCVNTLRRNVGTITGFDNSVTREKEPFDFENDDLHGGFSKINQLVPLKELFDCHIVEDARSPQDLRAFEIQKVHQDLNRQFACDLIGMDELWRVALEARDDGVAARAGGLMLALSRNLPPKFMVDFLERVFRELHTCYPLSSPPPVSPVRQVVARTPDDVLRQPVRNGAGTVAHAMQFDAPTPVAQQAHTAPASGGQTMQDNTLLQDRRQVRVVPGKGLGSARRGLRFSRALSLLQCVMDEHVLKSYESVALSMAERSFNKALLPHRCCVRGIPIKMTLKLALGKGLRGNKSSIQGSSINGGLRADVHHNSALNFNQNVGNQQQNRQPPNSALSNSTSTLGANSSFAGVGGGAGEFVLRDTHSNQTVKQLLHVAALLFPTLKGIPTSGLDIKLVNSTNGDRERTNYPLGKTLEEIGCVDGGRIIVLTRADGVGNSASSPLETASVLHLMSDMERVEQEPVTRRYKHVLASLQQLENRTDDELSEVERADLQEQLWLVLASLPTAGYIKKQVKAALLGEQQWDSILGTGPGIWRAAYLVQVVESMLQVSDSYLDIALLPLELSVEKQKEEADRKDLRVAFVEQGGAQCVLELVGCVCGQGQMWCHPERTSWRVCTPVFLRVLRLLLSHLPHLTSNTDQHKVETGTVGVSSMPSTLQSMSTTIATPPHESLSTSLATLAGTGRRVAMAAAAQQATSERSVDDIQETTQHAAAPHTNGSSSSAPTAFDLRDSLAKIVHILLEAVVMLSADPASSTASTTADLPQRSSSVAGNAGASSSTRCASNTAASTTIPDDAVVQSIVKDALNLIHMVIAGRGDLGPEHCQAIVCCIFQAHPLVAGVRGSNGKHAASDDPSAVTSHVDALIRQLLMGGNDEGVRKQTLQTLLEALVMGWETERVFAARLVAVCCSVLQCVAVRCSVL